MNGSTCLWHSSFGAAVAAVLLLCSLFFVLKFTLWACCELVWLHSETERSSLAGIWVSHWQQGGVRDAVSMLGYLQFHLMYALYAEHVFKKKGEILPIKILHCMYMFCIQNPQAECILCTKFKKWKYLFCSRVTPGSVIEHAVVLNTVYLYLVWSILRLHMFTVCEISKQETAAVK